MNAIRTLEQNALLHALLQEVAERRKWAGRSWDTTVWKRLLTASWMRAEGMHATILPALDGAGVDIIYEPTHKMSKQQVSSLIDYIQAWMVEEEAA
jgi:hypothetical protein